VTRLYHNAVAAPKPAPEPEAEPKQPTLHDFIRSLNAENEQLRAELDKTRRALAEKRRDARSVAALINRGIDAGRER
jgi:hypothetical protein